MAKNRYLIEYYTQDDLAYTNRKRYKTFSYSATSSEYQYAVRLGDGASTSVKTSLENLANYVCISLQTLNDNTQLYENVFTTRWYVTSYVYLNGGQIELFLQRDVIGENGLDGFFGKVERGYTETFLRNRKELSLNQRLIKRTNLICSDSSYGNYSVNSHNNEKWGIIYLTKPTEIDPKTGQPYPDTTVINIPKFSPDIANANLYPQIANGREYVVNLSIPSYQPIIDFFVKWNAKYYRVVSSIQISSDGNRFVGDGLAQAYEVDEEDTNNKYISITSTYPATEGRVGATFTFCLGYAIQENMPTISANIPSKDYNNIVIRDEQDATKLLKYTVTQESIDLTINNSDYVSDMISYFNSHYSEQGTALNNNCEIDFYSYGAYYLKDTYTYTILSPEQAGNLSLDMTQQLIDEPYICYAFPLYPVTISRPAYVDSEGNTVPAYSKTIDMETAFMVFNTVIQACSGENSYLVDAQIYPYCPDLSKISASINGYPFFSIKNTAFFRHVKVDLSPYLDIKKEYIKRDYYLVSPEQSANTHFNFYDYTNNIKTEIGDEIYNHQELEIVIKTALKPMNIICSAVITPQSEALKGSTYISDLRGCQATSNGFEFSLSTNKYQEYVRNNSNYQAIFALQKEELQRQHKVEEVNETTSAVVNTLTATMMGAIGGASLADYSYFGTNARGAGAAIGAVAAGATVGTAMGIQKTQNDKLREYEEYLQQQNFDLQIGTIKNIPNTVSRISSFNEIIMQDFYFVIETYECSEGESLIADTFIEKYGYGIGIFGKYEDFKRNGWFLRGTLISSNLLPIQHNVAQKEIMGGIYYYE